MTASYQIQKLFEPFNPLSIALKVIETIKINKQTKAKRREGK